MMIPSRLAHLFAAGLLAAAGSLGSSASFAATLYHWTDIGGVTHVTSSPPHSYDVRPEEWRRLRATYPEIAEATAGDAEPSLTDLPPGRQAEQLMQEWWDTAGRLGAYRGEIRADQEKLVELRRLLALADEALKKARGNDLSPSTGRAAASYQRARRVRLSLSGTSGRTSKEFEVKVKGRLEHTSLGDWFYVEGRVINRTMGDKQGYSLTLRLFNNIEVVEERTLPLGRILSGGERPFSWRYAVPEGEPPPTGVATRVKKEKRESTGD